MGRGALIRLRYIHAFTDRFGKRRYYFRRHGKRVALPGLPGAPEFMAAYAAAGSAQDAPARVARPPSAPGTFAALAARFFASPKFASNAPKTQRNYRRSLGAFMTKYGDRRVATMETQHVEAIIGKMADRPGAAIDTAQSEVAPQLRHQDRPDKAQPGSTLQLLQVAVDPHLD